MDSDLRPKLDELVEQLRRDERLRAIWLFGSAARGETGPTSDVDIALWTDESVSFDVRLELRSRVQQLLERNDVDVVFTDEASPVLNYRVVVDGRRLYARDPEAADRYEQRQLMRYFDTAHLRRTVQRLQKEAVE